MAQYEMLKGAGGVLCPADDDTADALQKLKNGGQYTVEIRRQRNPDFHRKVFAFFKFCFEHWAADKTELAHFEPLRQFDVFRKHLTVLAGYKTLSYTIDGRLRVEAESLRFANMEQAEFEQCYQALIRAALIHVFDAEDDGAVLEKLAGFF